MAKSVNAMLVAIADAQGILALDEPAVVPEWSAEDDRSAITHRHLIDMSSGLDFDEDYDPMSGEFFSMIFSGDTAHYASTKSLRHQPGEQWYYASSDSNLAARALQMSLEKHGSSIQKFAYENLFAPIGIRSAVLEVDAAGTFVGSSYVYATALDWLRLGQLVLQNGRWGSAQILPESYIAELDTPLPSSGGRYRNSIWLNRGDPQDMRFSGFPIDTRSFNGYWGQYVVVVPSKNLVMVRLGQTAGDPETVVAVMRDLYRRIGPAPEFSESR